MEEHEYIQVPDDMDTTAQKVQAQKHNFTFHFHVQEDKVLH